MRLSIRSHVIFVAGLLGATFGIGQLWNLALSLREGSASSADMMAGSLGLLPLVVGGLIVGRMLYLQGSVSRLNQAQMQDTHDDRHK